jgi:hypothetical protein
MTLAQNLDSRMKFTFFIFLFVLSTHLSTAQSQATQPKLFDINEEQLKADFKDLDALELRVKANIPDPEDSEEIEKPKKKTGKSKKSGSSKNDSDIIIAAVVGAAAGCGVGVLAGLVLIDGSAGDCIDFCIF